MMPLRREVRAEVEGRRLLDHLRVAHAGERREAGARLPPGDQRALVDARVDARRRRGAVPDPGVEGVEQRPQERAVVGGVEQVVGDAAARRVGGRAVLRAAEGVDAHVLRDRRRPSCPSGSVWTSEPLRCQYSAALCVCITFGSSFGSSAAVRRRMPSVRLLNGSVASP